MRGTGARTARDDRGSTTLELTVLFPVVLLLVFGLIQGALWYHARNVALAAATEGVEATRGLQGTQTAGEAAATSFVTRAGTDVIADLQVSSSRTPDSASVTVTVTGRSVSLLPGVPGPAVSQTATGPVERFTTEVSP